MNPVNTLRTVSTTLARHVMFGFMESITQTPFGRFLCWLGIHQLTWGQIEHPYAQFSLSGGCVRCNKSFGWDSA